jgi:hypothetical protein
MTDNLTLFILLAAMAFVAGGALTLIVAERSHAARGRRQALRERELNEFSAYINDRLALLSGDQNHRPPRSGP